MVEEKTRIKICGITSINQAIEIAKLGVDAIGIISVKESPRYVSNSKRRSIFKRLKYTYPNIKRVSVIKNLPINFISKDFTEYENVIQLHGDEDISYCKELKMTIPNVEIWKAFRIRKKEDIEQIKFFYNYIDAALLDSWNKDTYGGSGVRIDQKNLKNIKLNKQWWLAGGISIEWIDQILSNIKPNGIDISSSIEISPGIKNIKKTREIIKKIKK